MNRIEWGEWGGVLQDVFHGYECGGVPGLWDSYWLPWGEGRGGEIPQSVFFFSTRIEYFFHFRWQLGEDSSSRKTLTKTPGSFMVCFFFLSFVFRIDVLLYRPLLCL